MPVHLPALILAVLLTAYWGRVLRLVYKMRKRYGASANLAPKEPLGRLLRIIWVPAVLIWIIHPYITAFAAGKSPLLLDGFYHSRGIIGWTALAIGIGAFALTLICWKRMGKSWRMGINPDEKTQLIVTGPYAYLRHPIYSLQSLLMVASFLVVPSPLMAAIVLLLLGLLQWEAAREERHLVHQHGDAYAEYQKQVGGFIPRSFRPFSTRSPDAPITLAAASPDTQADTSHFARSHNS